jgi:hypothetical protein
VKNQYVGDQNDFANREEHPQDDGGHRVVGDLAGADRFGLEASWTGFLQELDASIDPLRDLA